MEACVGLSLLALFLAVFVSLSSRLATAQAQQSARSAALGHLAAVLAKLKDEGPASWSLPSQTIIEDKGGFRVIVSVEEKPLPFVADKSLGALKATATWRSPVGEHKVEREEWVHARL
jgi:hypothetical protein